MINKYCKLKTVNSKNSSLTVLEDIDCNFNFKRIYLLHNFTKKTSRGGHYHKNNKQIIICLNGKVLIKYFNIKNNREIKSTYLTKKNEAFYIDNFYWHELICYKNTIVLVVAEKNFNSKDYFTIDDV